MPIPLTWKSTESKKTCSFMPGSASSYQLQLFSMYFFWIQNSLQFFVSHMMETYGLSMFGITFEVALILKKGSKYIKAFQERSKLEKTLKKFKTVKEIPEKDKICAICFAEMTVGKQFLCGHIFHEDCIKQVGKILKQIQRMDKDPCNMPNMQEIFAC
eukprot:TRINITY_DN88913_c1_g1_i1.p5 TRINITY_DN88913_c1_g1~~TRINITY_DN88913_c1_g1_i1.p5  ORF type:complete len:158 (-),score=8.18 TRINITY_DN88913_c1_g1_i1:376-849(-)